MSDPVDDRWRAAQAAIAERAHLVRVKTHLANELALQERTIHQLALELRREQADVERLSVGVLGFLNELLGYDKLSREQQEVYEADVRLREAVAGRDALRSQEAVVAQRLAVLTPTHVAAELEAARSAKEQALLQTNTPAAEDLKEIDIQLMSIDIELVPLQDALVAGHGALATLAELLTVIDEARTSTESRQRAETTRGLAGEAQAKVGAFRRALGELAQIPSDADVLGAPAFADAWIRQLLGEGERAARLAAARASMLERLERVRNLIEPVRTRHDELAARRAALVSQRDHLLTPA